MGVEQLWSDKMTSLRVLCVLIVLATVCLEANCFWQGERWACSSDSGRLRCPRGQVFTVLGLVYQKRSGAHFYNHWMPCVRKLTAKVHNKCNGRRSCWINPRKLARSSRCERHRAFCLKISLRCQGRWKWSADDCNRLGEGDSGGSSSSSSSIIGHNSDSHVLCSSNKTKTKKCSLTTLFHWQKLKRN